MAFLPQGSVGQIADAYQNNPNALQERYGVTKQLIDLMALQRINAEQKAIANQMEMDLGQQAASNGLDAPIADQLAEETFGNTTNNIAQMAGLGGILNERKAQAGGPQAGAPQAGGPPQGQGIDQLPAQNMQHMSGGGIVAFANGTEDVIDSDRLRDLQTNSGPKDANIALLDEMLDAEGVTNLQERAFIRAIYEQESSSGTNPRIWDEGGYAESENIGDMQISEGAFSDVVSFDEELDINTREGNMRGGIRYALLGLEKAGGDPELGATFYYGGYGGLEAARSGQPRYDPTGPDMPSTLEYGSEVADMTSEIFGSLGYSEPDVEGVAQTTAEERAAQDRRRATTPEADVDELTALTMERRADAREAAYGEEEGSGFVDTVLGAINPKWGSNYNTVPTPADQDNMERVALQDERNALIERRKQYSPFGEDKLIYDRIQEEINAMNREVNALQRRDFGGKQRRAEREYGEQQQANTRLEAEGFSPIGEQLPNPYEQDAARPYSDEARRAFISQMNQDNARNMSESQRDEAADNYLNKDPRTRALYNAMGGDEASEGWEKSGGLEALKKQKAATSAYSGPSVNWTEMGDFLSGAQGTTTGSALAAGAGNMRDQRTARETLDRDENLQYAKLANDIRQIELRNKNELDQIRDKAKLDMEQKDIDAVDAAYETHAQGPQFMIDMERLGIDELDQAQQDLAIAKYVMEFYHNFKSGRGMGLQDFSGISGTTTVVDDGT